MKICCIVNDRSGTTASAKKYDLAELFAQRSVTVEVFSTLSGKSITELSKTAVLEGYDIIVAGGGDGTINAVASELVGHASTRLGVLPLGTLNHFARDLNISSDVSKAVDIICAGYSEAVDVGRVNDRYFLNNSSVGLYPAIVKLRESLQSGGYSKWWAAALSSLRILSHFRRMELEIHLSDGKVIRRKTALLFVGNNAYETSADKLGARLSLKDGTLWVSMPTSSTRFGLFMSLAKMLFRHERPADTLIFETTDLKVVSKKKILTVATDGEVLRLELPLIYSILPQALNVIVPMGDKETN